MISKNPIGDQVLWIVRRLREQEQIQAHTMKELDPFANRILLALHQSDKHGGGNHHWMELPPIDLWGLKPASKIKPQERVEGAIIKLIQFIVRKGGETSNNNTLRLIELFLATLQAAKEEGRVVRRSKSGRLMIEEEREEHVKSYVEKIVSQLTRLGTCEVLLNLVSF
jgi:hypothetical protein